MGQIAEHLRFLTWRREKQVFEEHKLFVIDSCFFSPDNKTLCVEGGKRGKNRKRENVLRLFNTETWEMTEEIEGYWITGIDMSRNGEIIAIAEEKKLHILDANSKQRIQKIGNRRYIYSIAISPNGKTV